MSTRHASGPDDALSVRLLGFAPVGSVPPLRTAEAEVSELL